MLRKRFDGTVSRADSYHVRAKKGTGSRTRKRIDTSWISVAEAGTKKGIRRQRTWTKAVMDEACLLGPGQVSLKPFVADTVKGSLLLLALGRRSHEIVQLSTM